MVRLLIRIACFFAQGLGPNSPNRFHVPQSIRHGHCDSTEVLQSSSPKQAGAGLNLFNLIMVCICFRSSLSALPSLASIASLFNNSCIWLIAPRMPTLSYRCVPIAQCAQMLAKDWYQWPQLHVL